MPEKKPRPRLGDTLPQTTEDWQHAYARERSRADRAEAEIATLKTALEPFARLGKRYVRFHTDDNRPVFVVVRDPDAIIAGSLIIRAGSLKRAYEAHGTLPEE